MECLLKISALMFIRYMSKRTQSYLIRQKSLKEKPGEGALKTLLPSLPGHSVPASQLNTSYSCLLGKEIQNAYKSE